jgi:hypothetical protein
MMQCSDPVKLAILAICLASCLTTLFTTWSFEMNGKPLPRLRPVVVGWCDKPRETLKLCREQQQGNSKGISDCTSQKQNVQKCDTAVQRAYRHLNLGGGCLKQNQMVVVCQGEWCDNNNNNPRQCEQECGRVRKLLDDCIHKQVQSYLPAFAK